MDMEGLMLMHLEGLLSRISIWEVCLMEKRLWEACFLDGGYERLDDLKEDIEGVFQKGKIWYASLIRGGHQSPVKKGHGRRLRFKDSC